MGMMVASVVKEGHHGRYVVVVPLLYILSITWKVKRSSTSSYCYHAGCMDLSQICRRAVGEHRKETIEEKSLTGGIVFVLLFSSSFQLSHTHSSTSFITTTPSKQLLLLSPALSFSFSRSSWKHRSLCTYTTS